MSAAHTPGPWFAFANATCVGGPVGVLGNPSGSDSAGVAHCGMALRTGNEVQANARLIAEAPSMLDALRQWRAAEATGDAAELENARAARDAAIAAATGDAS